MFWSDLTWLAQFGNVFAWPIYLFFRNLSKYAQSHPESGCCHPIVFIPSIGFFLLALLLKIHEIVQLPESIKKVLSSISGKKHNRNLLRSLQARACTCNLGYITQQRFHWSLQEWNCHEMLQRHHQESIPLDIHLLSRLSRKVSGLHACWRDIDQIEGSSLPLFRTKATVLVLIASSPNPSSTAPVWLETLRQDCLKQEHT